jgi:hypothetical protein
LHPGCACSRPLIAGTCNTKKYYNCYSSTNYVLLGLLLAAQDGASRYTDYDQKGGIKPALADFSHLRFAVEGAPAKYTPVSTFYCTTEYCDETPLGDVT